MSYIIKPMQTVAKDGDKVIGFVGYGKYRDDTLSDCGEVFAIYVLADY